MVSFISTSLDRCDQQGHQNRELFRGLGLGLWNLTHLSAILQLYHGSVLLVEEIREPEENLSQVTDKLYQIMLYRVHLA